jgi:hypothetical protein
MGRVLWITPARAATSNVCVWGPICDLVSQTNRGPRPGPPSAKLVIYLWRGAAPHRAPPKGARLLGPAPRLAYFGGSRMARAGGCP